MGRIAYLAYLGTFFLFYLSYIFIKLSRPQRYDKCLDMLPISWLVAFVKKKKEGMKDFPSYLGDRLRMEVFVPLVEARAKNS